MLLKILIELVQAMLLLQPVSYFEEIFLALYLIIMILSYKTDMKSELILHGERTQGVN